MDIYQILKCDKCGLRFPLTNNVFLGNLHCVSCSGSVQSLRSYKNYQGKKKELSKTHLSSLVFVLDNIRSAWNVGSMFRSSDAAGVDKLYLCGISPTPDNIKVQKTSLGAEQKISWEHVQDGLSLVQNLRNQGYVLIAMEKTVNSKSLFNFSKNYLRNDKLAIVLGHEVGGVDPDILEYVDEILHLPMQGLKNSLNVASVFSLTAYFLQYCFI